MGVFWYIAAVVYGCSVTAGLGCGLAARYSPAIRRYMVGDQPPRY